MYSSSGNNFVKTILRLAREKEEIRVVDDQIGSPTWAADLAAITVIMIRQHKDTVNQLNWGVCHYSNDGECSWYNFAKEIVSLAGLKTSIKPIGTSEFPAKAIRPPYSVLDTTLMKNWLGIDIPKWKDSLAKCLKEILNQQ